MRNLFPQKIETDPIRAKRQFYLRILECIVRDYFDCSTGAEREDLMQFKMVASDEINTELNCFQRVLAEFSQETINKIIKITDNISPLNPLDHEQTK